MTPSDEAELEVTEERQFTVENPVADTTHTIALAPADAVEVGASGNVTFDDGDPGNDEYGEWDTEAYITVVNGTTTGNDGDEAEDVETTMPSGDQITFTIVSDDPDSVVPVVFFDEDEDGDLDLDEADAPTADEVFGIGGETTWIPAEAGQGALGTDETIVRVDKAADRIVADATYFYDDNDAFYVVNGEVDETAEPAETCTAGDQVTLAEFENDLSADDQLDASTVYQPNEALSSSFCLEDLSPVAPDADAPAVTDVTDTSLTLTFDQVDEDAEEVTVYCESDDDTESPDPAEVTTTDSDICATATEDADDDADDFQVVVSDLDPVTTYALAGTQTVDGEESALTEEATQATEEEGATANTTILNAEIVEDTIVTGVPDTGDSVEVVFSDITNYEDTVSPSVTIEAVDEDGDVIVVSCVESLPETPEEDVTYATCAPEENAPEDGQETDTVTLLNDAADANVAGDDAISWPLTITAIDGLVGGNGEAIDLANSADVLVDDEG